MKAIRWIAGVFASAAALGAAGLVGAQQAQQKSATDGIAEYRKMLEDGNPA